MLNDYITIFFIGLLGGFSHCLGMCGGLVISYSMNLHGQGGRSGGARWQTHLLYNSGRILTYMILGEIFGLLGSTLGFILAVKNIQSTLELVAGIIMLLMGLNFIGLWPGWAADSFPGINSFKKVMVALINKLSSGNIFILGMILGLMPCGLIYAVGAKAVATQSPLGGMMTMLLFGLGTFPALFSLGISTEFITMHWRHRLYLLAAALLIFLAVLTIMHGIDALDWYHFYWLP